MFDRFTKKARQVLVLAQDEARDLKHNYIGTEHILLGLLREDGTAARVLAKLDVTLEEVRSQIARIVGPGTEAVSGPIPFTPRAKKVLELSLREALALGHDYIGTEHILLGVIRENKGVGAGILLDLDANADKIRSRVLDALGGRAFRGGRGSQGEVKLLEHAVDLGPSPLIRDSSRLFERWLLFAVSLGIGVVIGWGIWGP